ncbi:CCHC-type domain-containing protein [Abeliophyllum distichum]|uniref:CCHC-type domain-containing protein n=1 Tax=Abeliophyllum distichum TaxID=126358 RepID=A0ABD1TL10_9LAMI
MPTIRSGKIYSPTMDLAQITQVLERLSPQLAQLETRIQEQSIASEHRLAELEATIQNNEKSVGGGNRHPRRNVRNGGNRLRNNEEAFEPEERVLKSIKVEAPSFEGQLNPKVFVDWLSDIDHYFQWYEMSEARKVRFAKMKLSLRQGSMTTVEYIAKFEEFMLRCNVNKESSVTLSRFRTGFRLELQRELIPHDVNPLEQAYQLVQELEHYLKIILWRSDSICALMTFVQPLLVQSPIKLQKVLIILLN